MIRIGTTAAGGGPGVGDTIVFFKDVLVAWAYNGGSLQLYPIGWTEATNTALQIQSNPGQVGIAASDQQLLLSFDPFVAGGPFGQLPEGRFTVPAGVEASIEYGGSLRELKLVLDQWPRPLGRPTGMSQTYGRSVLRSLRLLSIRRT